LRALTPEYDGDCGDIAISTRVRLARNLRDYPFPGAMSAEQEAAVLDKISVFLQECAGGHMFRSVDLDRLKRENPFEPVAMVERHLISKELVSKEGRRGVVLSADERVSVMVNEEDHLRIQSLGGGLCLRDCMETVSRLERLLEAEFRFAHSERLGWLTRCPTNLGTGLRASVMLHLPAHTDSGEMHNLAAILGKTGYTVRGLYGEGTKAVGAIYQISNPQTMGAESEQIIESLHALILRIIAREHEIQHALDSHYPGYIEDKVWRSYGILANARRMSGEEAMRLLSAVRTGVSIGEMDLSIPMLNRLIHRIQPNTLCSEERRALGDNERDQKRAALLRGQLRFHE
jgi:protein arginine kinase